MAKRGTRVHRSLASCDLSKFQLRFQLHNLVQELGYEAQLSKAEGYERIGAIIGGIGTDECPNKFKFTIRMCHCEEMTLVLYRRRRTMIKRSRYELQELQLSDWQPREKVRLGGEKRKAKTFDPKK